MIPLRVQEVLRERFAAELAGPVRIDFFTVKQTGIIVPGREECRTCPDAQVLMEELAAVAGGRISLTVYDFYTDRAAVERNRVDKVPCAALRGLHRRRIRHYGLPMGTTFAALIDGLVFLSTGQSGLAKETVRQLQRLSQEVHLEILIGKTDEYSARMARLGYQFAVESERLRVDIVELEEFPRLIQRYHVPALPLTVLDSRLFCVGLLDEHQLVARIEDVISGRIIQPPPGPSVPVPQVTAGAAPSSGQQLPSGLILP